MFPTKSIIRNNNNTTIITILVIIILQMLVKYELFGIVPIVVVVSGNSLFRTKGPIVTITIPQDLISTLDSSSSSNDDYDSAMLLNTTRNIQNNNVLCTVINTIQPSITYTISTKQQPPLPYWLPSLKSYTTQIGYHHTNNYNNNHHHRLIRDHYYHQDKTRVPISISPTSDDNNNVSTTTQKTHQYYIDNIAKFEWNYNNNAIQRWLWMGSSSSNNYINTNNNMKRNMDDIVQIAIQPYKEWITTRTITTTKIRKPFIRPNPNDPIIEQTLQQQQQQQEQQSTSTSTTTSSLLLHLKHGNSKYAWLRLLSTSSFLSSYIRQSSPPSTTSRNDWQRTDKNINNIHMNDAKIVRRKQQQQQLYEATLRASTKLSVPLASISCIRLTPTIRIIQERTIPVTDTMMVQQHQNTASDVDYRDQMVCQYDTSLQVEVVSGGQGRTTGTITVSPFSNVLSSSSSSMKSKFLTLAMEYRLSTIPMNWNFGRGWWNRRRRQQRLLPLNNDGSESSSSPLLIMQRQHNDNVPQHWIRQIWEWDPSTSWGKQGHHLRFYNNKMIATQYQWLIVWPSGKSLHTIFDPPPSNRSNEARENHSGDGGITITFTDPTYHKTFDYWESDSASFMDRDTTAAALRSTDGRDGTWITDIHIPFIRSTSHRRQKSLLSDNIRRAEIRVRRQFSF